MEPARCATGLAGDSADDIVGADIAVEMVLGI